MLAPGPVNYCGERREGSGYDQTENSLGTWSKTKIPPGMRHPGRNQEQQKAYLYSRMSMFDVAGWETRATERCELASCASSQRHGPLLVLALALQRLQSVDDLRVKLRPRSA